MLRFSAKRGQLLESNSEVNLLEGLMSGSRDACFSAQTLHSVTQERLRGIAACQTWPPCKGSLFSNGCFLESQPFLNCQVATTDFSEIAGGYKIELSPSLP